MKMFCVIALLVVSFVFAQGATAAVSPENFTGTWKGTLTLIGSTKDIDVTLKVSCTDGKLMAEANFDNRHYPTEAKGEVSEITPNGDELTIVLTYRAIDPPSRGKIRTPSDGSQARYTLKLKGETLEGPAQNLRSNSYFNVKLHRTEAMVACIITSASAR